MFGPFSATQRFTPQAAPVAASLSAVSVNPTSVVGPASSNGTVTLTAAAPTGGTLVTLTSSNTAVATVPASVTVAPGATSASFTINTVSVSATNAVVISASFNGVPRSATLTVTAVPPPTLDTVSITLDEYVVSKKQLRVQATSTSTTATLQILVTSTGALIGTLTNNGAGGFSGQVSWPVNPQTITATSSAGGSATKAVVAK